MENVDSIINSALENTHTILNFEVTSLQPLEDADTSFTIYSNPIDDIQQKAAEEHHNDISEQENNTGKAVSSISGGDIECPVYIESVTAEPSIEAGNHIEDSSTGLLVCSSKLAHGAPMSFHNCLYGLSCRFNGLFRTLDFEE